MLDIFLCQKSSQHFVYIANQALLLCIIDKYSHFPTSKLKFRIKHFLEDYKNKENSLTLFLIFSITSCDSRGPINQRLHTFLNICCNFESTFVMTTRCQSILHMHKLSELSSMTNQKQYFCLDPCGPRLECQPTNQRVMGLITSQGICLGCKFIPGPRPGKYRTQPMNMSLSSSLLPVHSL